MRILIITPTLNESIRLPLHIHNMSNLCDQYKGGVVLDTIYVDGGSTDNTLKILSSEKVISQPGGNIYDAFNVGIEYAFEHEYGSIMFLGVGDVINKHFLLELEELGLKYPKSFKGYIMYSDFFWNNSKKKRASFRLSHGLMGFPHSGTIFPLYMFENNVFNSKYTIAADLDWLLRSRRDLKDTRSYKFSEPMVTLEAGGISMSREKRMEHLKQFISICCKHKVFPSIKFILMKLM